MDYRLPALAIVVLMAIAAIASGVLSDSSDSHRTPAAVEAKTELNAESDVSRERSGGAQLIDQVLRRLEASPPIAAKVRHRTRLFDQRLVGSGTYLQQQGPRGTLSRFSLSIRADDRAVSLLHICDGRYLWVRDSTANARQVSRVDLRRVSEAVAAHGEDPAVHFLALGGGLARLLASLKTNFDFAQPYAMTFQDVPVWAVACQWKPDRLRTLFRSDDGLFDADGRLRVDQLPAQMPDRVFLLIGRDDLFPYHIDFRRSAVDAEVATGKSQRGGSQSLVTIEMFEVQFGAAITPTAFVYRTGDVNIDDRTDEYLARIKLGL